MKTKILIFLFFLISQLGQAQLSRRTLHGQVVNDSIKVENVVIFNVNARTGTITKAQGFFDIVARENDTLVFSSLLFKSKKVVVAASDLDALPFKVALKTFTNELSEVVVQTNKANRPIENSQKIVDKKYFDDEKSSPKNTLMPNYNVTENGLDFVRMYKDVIRLLRKKNPKKNDFTSDVTFTELVMKKINYPFFSNTLKLEDDQIKLFLVFCENDADIKSVSKLKTDFELMDFLIGKNDEFKKIASEK